MPHPQNIVIGGTTVIGNNCTIYQNVTIGQKHDFYPVINDNVTIYSGAVVVGKITIGKNAVVGANAVVIHDVLENEVVGGIPAHKIGIR